MNTATHYYMRGLGAPPLIGGTAGAVAGVVAGAGTAAMQIIQGNYVGGIGSAILTAAPFAGPIGAPIMLVAGAVAELLGAIGIGRGCGQTCIKASQYANQAEPLLQQNLDAYLAVPAPRPQSIQTGALNVFDTVWAGLVSACNNPSLADPGQRCITDRQRGACHYQVAPGAGCPADQPTCWVPDGAGGYKISWGGGSGSGSSCWNWFVGYRDPIANDPAVVPDSVLQSAAATASAAIAPISAAASSVLPAGVTASLASAGIDPTWLFIGAGVLVLVMVAS